VAVGEAGGIELSSLMRHYHAIVFAYGAVEDSELGIPGESTLKGIYSARQFVGWYNGHPDYADLAPQLRQGEEAVIIGQGNVALDIARMLLGHVDVLRKTDITQSALAQLATSQINRVHIVGRRGPMQVSFLQPKCRYLCRLLNCSRQHLPSRRLES
jgi:adrenodoxin-NADP+ reductase